MDVTTGSKEYTNIMEVFPAQELVLEDGTLCISVTDKQLLYLDAGRSADEIFVSVNGEPVEIPEKNQMASAHRLIWLGTFEAQEDFCYRPDGDAGRSTGDGAWCTA